MSGEERWTIQSDAIQPDMVRGPDTGDEVEVVRLSRFEEAQQEAEKARELLEWAEMYGHPEGWAKRAQAAHGRAERAEAEREAYRNAQIRSEEARHKLAADLERAQAAIDKAYSALDSASYVGGPTEREAWLAAVEALGPLVTQHTGENHPKVAEARERGEQ